MPLQSDCQNLEIVSASKELYKVWQSREEYTHVEYCKVAIKSDKTSKLMHAKLAKCPDKKYFVGSVEYACNDIINLLEYDKIREQTVEDCPAPKKWWEFWK